MEPMTMMALASLAQTGGGLLGNLMGSGDRASAAAAMREALQNANNLQMPDLTRAVNFLQQQTGGQLSPEILAKLAEEYSDVPQIQEDMTGRDATINALNDMAQITRTGMTPQDALMMAKARRDSGAESQARLASIKNDRAQRGLSGGGDELATMLQSAQASDDRASMGMMEAAAAAGNRREQALRDYSSMGSNLREMDLKKESDRVQSERQNREMLMKNAMARQQYNANQRSQSNMFNLMRNQEVQDQNTNRYNEDLNFRMRVAPQQMFQNNVSRTGLINSALGGQANFNMANAQNTAQNWANIGGGVGTGLSGMAQYKNNQQTRADNNANFQQMMGALGNYGKKIKTTRY